MVWIIPSALLLFCSLCLLSLMTHPYFTSFQVKGRLRLGARVVVSELSGRRVYKAVPTVEFWGSLVALACLEGVCYPLVLWLYITGWAFA